MESLSMTIRLLALLFLLVSCDKFTTWTTPKGGDFVLQSTNGKLDTVSLRGKTLFIFFGFLHCPHVCPTTTRELNRMVKALSEKEKGRIVPIFVTVDPARDTIPVLKEHFSTYDPIFVAATGTEAEIRSALGLFGGGFKVFQGKSPEDIFVDHTSTIFVINRKGEWVNSLPYDAPQEELKKAYDIAYSQKPYWSEEARAGRVKQLGQNDECDLAQKPCDYQTDYGNYQVEIVPRPIKHLQRSQVIVRSKDIKLTPKVADFVALELPMGLIRPKLVKTNDNTWVGGFTLPTCDLKGMNWHLRLLLVDREKENNEIRFKFSSINEKGTL